MAEDPEEDDDEQPKKKNREKPPGKPRDWPLIAMVGGTAIFILGLTAVTMMAPRRPMLFIRAIGEVMSRKAPDSPKVSLTPSSGAPASSTPAAGTATTGTPAPGTEKPGQPKPADTKPPAKP
ncbi:MAG: hypothetical protein EPO26_01735 [Chloroflexota bacterium]|nr:MAG: hypothetical protein EPO26_01735 [Chloroflexota bacterium]